MKRYRRLLKKAGFNFPDEEGSHDFESKLKELAKILDLEELARQQHFADEERKILETFE